MNKNKKQLIWAILFAALFAVWAACAKAGILAEPSDAITAAVLATETPWLSAILIAVSHLGQWYVYVPTVLLLLALPRTRMAAGLPIAATLAASAILNNILKLLFQIERPPVRRLIVETGFGFPSGHVMNAAVFLGICLYFLFKYGKNKAVKSIVAVLAMLFFALTAFGRIYLGVHTPVDVIGGFLCGMAVLMAGIAIDKKRVNP